MSKLERRRKKVNYETNVPRCGTCIHIKTYGCRLRDSLPQRTVHLCAKHEFTCASFSVCDDWQSKTGETF